MAPMTAYEIITIFIGILALLMSFGSGTGKTFLYGMLEDMRFTEEYKAIKLFNYKSDDFLETIKRCRNNFIVMGLMYLIRVLKCLGLITTE